ncbi:unnamed protein product [Ambrosiozyma monospora]|uniref:Unnamed protein product n=1 Tax=Ambrosiozyma monospora TaxID=43982 RepID=A0A9W6Z7J6_AMBMO|nr:unnamed protein product [Ambrosiozyma monospora]
MHPNMKNENQQETITHINDHDDTNNDDDTTSNNNNNTLNITIGAVTVPILDFPLFLIPVSFLYEHGNLFVTDYIELTEYFKNQKFKKKPAVCAIQRLLEVDRSIQKLPLSADWKKNSIQQRKAMINCHVFKIGNHKGGQNQTGEAQEEGSRFN